MYGFFIEIKFLFIKLSAIEIPLFISSFWMNKVKTYFCVFVEIENHQKPP